MTRFTTVVALMLALTTILHAEPTLYGSGKLKMIDGQLVMVCHTLKCFAVEAIRQQVAEGKLAEPIKLDSQEACDRVNFALIQPIGCEVIQR